MNAASECVACFEVQARGLAKRLSVSPAEQELFVIRFMERLHTLDLTQSPPAIAGRLFPLAEEMFGISDPFYEYKKLANEKALQVLPVLQKKIANTPDPLRAAVNISIIGNYMDVSADLGVDWFDAVDSEDEAAWGTEAFSAFAKEVKGGGSVLIIGDNCGEIVLDTLLVDELIDLGCEVTYAVRGGAILNDATFQDAEAVGMVEKCPVISSGVATPGTLLEDTTPQFKEVLEASDVIISKGQGNFEGLYGEYQGVYFAFKAKCKVVADAVGVEQGTSMFVYR